MFSARTGIGDVQSALEWLERAVEDRSYWTMFLAVDPMCDPLRSDRWFTAALARIDAAL